MLKKLYLVALVAILCLSFGGCTGEQIARAQVAVDKAEMVLNEALKYREEALSIAEKLEGEKAAEIIRKAESVVSQAREGAAIANEALKSAEDGTPWWQIALQIVGSLAGGALLGYRKGLMTPVPQPKK